MIYFLVAGEASGDKLGANLMRGIKMSDKKAQFHGVGGALMQAEGLQSLLPMASISFIGFTTVFLHIRSIYRAINHVADQLNRIKPDRFISIDSPDFAIRLCRRIKVPTQKIHYVAPTVWAMRPKRAADFAHHYDAILTLFPFEPALFNRHKNCAYFIGHDMFQSQDLQIAKKDTKWRNNFCNTNGIKANKLIAILPGSRFSEVKTLMPIFVKAAEKILLAYPETHFIIPSFKQYHDIIAPQITHLPCHIIDDDENRFSAMAACDMAIAASGTISLHLAYLQVPHLVAYKVGKLNFFIARLLLTIKQFNLFNLMAESERQLLPANHPAIDRQFVPEYIQEKCIAEDIAEGAVPLLDKTYAANQLSIINLLLQQMQPPELSTDYIAKKIDLIFAERPIG